MKLLVLSIGSNPLPNYIVAKYLLMNEREDRQYLPKPDKIMMVFSNDTEKFHKSIVELLNIGKDKRIDVCIEDGQRSFDGVYNAVSNSLHTLGKISKLQYNYTGGTKPMVLAITQAVKELFPDSTSDDLILSDFSAENYKIVKRDGNSFPAFTTINEVISISIEELYQLHCLKNVTLSNKNSEFYNLERVKFLFHKRDFFNKLTRKETDDFFRYWNNIDASFKKDPEACKSALIKSIKETPFADYIPDIEQLTSNKSLKNIRSLQSFIRGVFLEEYVFDILNKMREELGLTDIAWNVKAYVKNRDFELDIVAMKGCEVFVLSCTTDSTIGLCKSKAFEVFYRAEMMGGAKAQSVLVCMGDNSGSNKSSYIENISADMQQFDAAKNFKLITKDELLDPEVLKIKLKNIITGD